MYLNQWLGPVQMLFREWVIRRCQDSQEMDIADCISRGYCLSRMCDLQGHKDEQNNQFLEQVLHPWKSDEPLGHGRGHFVDWRSTQRICISNILSQTFSPKIFGSQTSMSLVPHVWTIAFDRDGNREGIFRIHWAKKQDVVSVWKIAPRHLKISSLYPTIWIGIRTVDVAVLETARWLCKNAPMFVQT